MIERLVSRLALSLRNGSGGMTKIARVKMKKKEMK